MRRLRLREVGAAAAAVLTLAACSADAEEPSPTPTPTAGGLTAADLGERVAAASLAAGSATAEVSSDGSDGSVRADVVYRFSADRVDLAASAEFSGAIAGQSDVVLVDDELYVEVPAAFRLFVSTPWLRLPMDGEFADQSASLLDSLAARVPGAELAGSTAPVVEGGPERVGEGLCDRYEVDGPSVTSTYWLSSDDLPCQVASARGGDAEQVVTYRDWGGEVTIAAPPAGEVGDLPG